jgi:hypothetical protein
VLEVSDVCHRYSCCVCARYSCVVFMCVCASVRASERASERECVCVFARARVTACVTACVRVKSGRVVRVETLRQEHYADLNNQD